MKKLKLNLFKLFPSFIKNWKHGDKVAHFILILPIYIIFTFIFDFPIINEYIGHRRLSLFLSMLVAAGIEIVDDNTPGNRANPYDMLWTWCSIVILWYLQDVKGLLIFF